MGDKSEIEWTDATWNCLRGCTHVSAGCDHCYAASIAYRYSAPGQAYEGLAEKGPDGVPRFNGTIRLVPEHLDDPLRWTRPRRIFVNSMSDLFHIEMARRHRDYLDAIFAVMALAPRHTFQALTKRPALAAAYLNDPETPGRIRAAMLAVYGRQPRMSPAARWPFERGWELPWPLPNVWLGTSVESDREMHRVDALKRAPAAVHFLSCEPLLGPLNLDGGWLYHIEWVIAGGESGPHYRPLNLDWARGIRDQCVRAGVPFLLKQVGGYTPKAGGRLLDGRTWDEYPDALSAVAVASDE